MLRLAKALLCAVPWLLRSSHRPRPRNRRPNQTGKEPDKAGAYYNFAMGRLYAQMASAEGNKNDYINKSIQHYREALRLDPSANIVFEELTDLYIQTNRLADAVTASRGHAEAEPGQPGSAPHAGADLYPHDSGEPARTSRRALRAPRDRAVRNRSPRKSRKTPTAG